MDLPKQIIRVLCHFEGAFSERVWEWAKVLVIGAILVPGERTVAAILRVTGQKARETVPELPSCAQPSEVVFADTQSHSLAFVDPALWAGRYPHCGGHRRDD